MKIEKARQDEQIEFRKAQERPLLEILERRKLDQYREKADLSEKELTQKSTEYILAALHNESIDIMATWWRNFIQSEREQLNSQRNKLDTEHVGSFEKKFHRIESIQVGFYRSKGDIKRFDHPMLVTPTFCHHYMLYTTICLQHRCM